MPTDDTVTFKPLAGLGRTRVFPLSDITDVTAYADAPARLRINPRNTKPLVLMVVPKRTTSVMSDDTAARDEAGAAINARREA